MITKQLLMWILIAPLILLSYLYDIKHGHKFLFIYTDWKEAIDDFLLKLERILKDNFDVNKKVPVDYDTRYNEIIENGVLEQFDNFLRTKQLQLTYIET